MVSRAHSQGPHERGLRAARAALLAFALAAQVGCELLPDPDKNPPPPGTQRSIGLTAKPTASEAPRPSNTTAAKAPKALCTSPLSRPAPRTKLEARRAQGATELGASPGFGTGKWVWVNLWAAWCGPCKEELPRLFAWQKKLRAAGVLLDLAFVSLDDDERQLERFLEQQPTDGLRASYWLPEGSTRSSFLKEAGLAEMPQLPLQVLVAPSGEIRCVVQGAVEESDYAAIAQFVGAKP